MLQPEIVETSESMRNHFPQASMQRMTREDNLNSKLVQRILSQARNHFLIKRKVLFFEKSSPPIFSLNFRAAKQTCESTKLCVNFAGSPQIAYTRSVLEALYELLVECKHLPAFRDLCFGEETRWNLEAQRCQSKRFFSTDSNQIQKA